jgi:hypothetical protein
MKFAVFLWEELARLPDPVQRRAVEPVVLDPAAVTDLALPEARMMGGQRRP